MSSTFTRHFIFAPIHCFFFDCWVTRKMKRRKEGERENEKKLLLSGARMMSWGHLSSWCGGFPSSANYLVQTRIWYGGYEAQIQLLWANKEILRFREWGRDSKWDRREGTRTAIHVHTHIQQLHALTRVHTHPSTHTNTTTCPSPPFPQIG